MIFEKYKPLILGLWALFSFSVYSGNIYAKQTENTTVPQPVQNATVKGVVKDATGEPLIGVSVVVKGTTNGAVTDVNGNFSIACSANDILVFSYIGYDKIEVKAGNASFHTITMKEDSELLDEVIVIGYGTTTRKHVIGAVDQIRDDVIKDRPVANITQALQGATPSLSIQQRNMNPNNNNININIRGVSSMNNNDPLVVIDGMAANDINAMNLLNPNDIESVSVLKDAGTAAIYGSRSANGVILITTKQGRTDMKPVVTFTASVGGQHGVDAKGGGRENIRHERHPAPVPPGHLQNRFNPRLLQMDAQPQGRGLETGGLHIRHIDAMYLTPQQGSCFQRLGNIIALGWSHFRRYGKAAPFQGLMQQTHTFFPLKLTCLG